VTVRSATTASTVALSGGATFGVLLLGMHVLKPEIAPSWRFISEYALGDFGWLMHLAFLAFAGAHLGLVVSLHRLVFRSWPARLGLGALALSGAGFALAGVFRTDPVTLDPHLATTAGKLHAFGGALGMAMPMAVALVSWSLIRNGVTTRSAVWPTAAGLFGRGRIDGGARCTAVPQRRPVWTRRARRLAEPD